MKKRIKLDSEEIIMAEIDPPAIRKAVISLFKATDSELVLMVEESGKPKVFLLVGYNEKNNTLEYQISDGMDCYRSQSRDCYNLKDAIKLFKSICKNGWSK